VLEDRTVPSFLPPVAFPGPSYVGAVGDLNNDGRADLLYSGGYSGTVVVQLSNGDGTFQAARSSAAGGRLLKSLVPGDFNGDGRLDVLSVGLGGVNLLLGSGDGTFQAPRPVSMPVGGAHTVVAGDLNGDGRLDLVAGLELDGAMHFHPTDGGYSSSGSGYYTVEYTAYTSVLLGRGDGSFAAASTTLVGQGEHSTVLPRGGIVNGVVLELGDFDGDGHQDILAGGTLLYHQAKLLRGRGDGTMATPQPTVEFGTFVPSVGDFNGDSRADLVTSGGVLLGNGDGTFRTVLTFPEDTAVRAIGDFNGDGKLDVVATTSSNGTVSVLLGNGNGTFQPARTFAAEAAASAVAVGDFSGDGWLDLAVTNGNSLSVLLNDRHW
jgi:hypothetical protein